MLRFDGLYCFAQGRVNSCLRFYEDGLVINASIGGEEGKPAFPRAYWFNRYSDSPSRGNYTVDGTWITFLSECKSGKVAYEGEIREDRLILSSKSYINDNRTFDRDYVFYPFTAIPTWNKLNDDPPASKTNDDDDDHDDDNRSQDQY